MRVEAYAPVVDVALRADDVAAAARSRHGLTYKGFGVLSGNATSALLLDYKAEHPEVYWRLVESLFGGTRPLMTLVKIEMGNDRNNSTGPNAATMRDRGERPRVLREPGFQLAADARRFQPDLHVSILRWGAPTWVRGNDDVYRWYKNTILACYRTYGFMVDSVNPDVNERTPDLAWVAEFARRVRGDDEGYVGAGPDDPESGWSSVRERELFRGIRVITSDEESTGGFGPELTADAALREAIDVAAYHYSAEDDDEGSFVRLADEFDKEVWNSEAQAVFSCSADRPCNTDDRGLGDGSRGTGIGGPGSPLEMANTVIKGFVASRRTCVIYQPAIGACHAHMEYAAKELVCARDPWSGWVYYDAGCAALAHFASFARFGWNPETAWRAVPQASGCAVGGRNPVNGARHGEPSYLTFAAPDGSAFSMVAVNDSALTATYRIAVDAALPAAGGALAVWRTAACDPGERYDAGWLRRSDGMTPERVGDRYVYTLVVGPWSMATTTSLLDVEPSRFPVCAEGGRPVLDADPAGGVLYADDFRYCGMPDVEVSRAGGPVVEPYLAARGGEGGAVPRYTTDSNGAFEVVPDAGRGHALRQQIDWAHAGDAWIEGDPRTAIGDMRWADYRVDVDVLFEPYPGRAPYALVGAREMGGVRETSAAAAYDVVVQANGVFRLRRYGQTKAQGHLEDLRRLAARCGRPPFAPGAGVWNRIGLEVAGGEVSASVNGAVVARWHDDAPQSAGRVVLGTSFDHVRFSGLRVARVPGLSPYCTALIDDMHMVSWDDSRTPVLEYNGAWTHEHGQDMFTYMRTISVARRPGAELTVRFFGTGLDLFGPSDGAARLDVDVDGAAYLRGEPSMPNDGSLRTMLRVEGLAPGRHAVTVRLANPARFAVDAVGVRA